MSKDLTLKRADSPRMPGLDKNDFNVLWQGRTIGRIWRFAYLNHPWSGRGDWHWRWGDLSSTLATQGHAPTLEAAMADFRRAWDRKAE